MALYEYECKPNGHRFEVRHGMNESPVQSCLECRGDVRRVITAPGIVFKGSGFYATDSRKTSGAAGESQATSKDGESPPKAVSAETMERDTKRDAAAPS